ncbi:MAG: dihydropteroate synthase [Inquilinus sp.]|nr:dihydropteroate synthase [Inquilinus sp.]
MTDATDGPGSFRGLSVSAEGAALYLRPLDPFHDPAGRVGLPLAGGPLRFARVEAILRGRDGVARASGTLAEAEAWGAAEGVAAGLADRLARLTAPRPVPGPADAALPRLMGVVNVTPDSFSDGGDFADPGRAIEHGLALLEEGADILDIGGESTRPGAEPVSPDEEAARVLPVIEALARAGATISIDTRHAVTLRAALDAGATILNDVTALTGDPDSLATAAASGAPVVLMHMQGQPRTMQADPRYDDAPLDVYDFLAARVAACEAAGLPRERLTIDPGIGFGKTAAHNARILRHTALLHGLGCPVLIGVSRKRFIAALSRDEPPKQRLGGSLAAALAAVAQGAQILRVHDVAQTRQALAVWRQCAPYRPENVAIPP